MASHRGRTGLSLLAAVGMLTGSVHADAHAMQANPAHAASMKNRNLARNELDDAIRAMGGKDVLDHIRRLHIKARTYRNMLEQSERPEGPWIPDFSEMQQWSDFDEGTLRTLVGNRQWGPSTDTVVAGDMAITTIAPDSKNPHARPGRRKSVRMAHAQLALGPARILLTALAADDLHAEAPVHLQHVPQKVLAFTWHKAPVRLYLNAWTSLPTMVEITRPHPWDVFWNLWGDVTTRTWYSFWAVEPGGFMYPQQWDIWRHGQHARTLLVTQMDINPPATHRVAFTDAQRQAFKQQKPIDDYPLPDQPQTVAPGIELFAGSWNTSLVVQDDGVVVLEAPMSGGYSKGLIKFVQEHFPGKRIKAVVSTSNAWPHVGGVREYVAHGLPLYVLDLNMPFVRNVLAAPHVMRPDDLARHPHAADLHSVSHETVIGTGANRIVLYPVHGEAGERMMLAWFPGRKLLYASDLVQPIPGGGFGFPEYLTEVAAVVTRHHLAVDKVFAMHSLHPLAWQTVLDAIKKAKSP